MTWIARSALFVLLLLGLIPLACSGEPATVDNTRPLPVACEELADCYSSGNYELGTECRNNQCVCPDWEGMSPLPCCEKGADPLDCRRQCRHVDDCAPEPGSGSAGGTTASSSSGAGGEGMGGSGGAGGEDGGVIVPACVTTADCAEKPADARCGKVECISGQCQLTFEPIEKIVSQIRGDCVSTYCDGQGATIVLPDGEDEYNDGKECTMDTCENLTAKKVLFPNGSPCPETGAGVCFDGECVECINGIADICGNGFGCEGLLCLPTTCWQNKNDMIDPPLESGVDCGGQCYPCFSPQTCKTGTDCVEGVCSGGTCALPTHNDGVKNDNETGVDCGCDNCMPCPDGYECEKGENCHSLVCWAGKCQVPKCNDGLQNGEETGIDCGPVCNSSCP